MTDTKWCSFHQRKEKVSSFQKNESKLDGFQNVCREAQNQYMNDYNEANRNAINEKSVVYQSFKYGHLSEEQKVSKIRIINKKYGITSRV